MNLAPVELANGQRFGKLTVVRMANSRKKRGPKYICGCACGAYPVFVKASRLKSGSATECPKCAASAKEAVVQRIS